MKNDYYTYAFLRENGTPYYIGKGRGERAFRKRRGRAQPPAEKSRILILKKNLTEGEAFQHEIYMIALYGRKDIGTGILWNFTDGGEGGAGKRLSKETKQKISEAQKGRKLSEETKRRIKEAKKVTSPETREKMRQARLGTKHTPETLEKLRDAKKGDRNPNSGGLTEKHKQAIAEAQRKKWASGRRRRPKEEMSEHSRRIATQVWKSTVDGFRGNAGNVARHNKANGWDPNARVRIS